jgi:uncharacterized protein (TIGR03435 family)
VRHRRRALCALLGVSARAKRTLTGLACRATCSKGDHDDDLASGLRFVILRPVVNKTGLAGSYSLTMTFDGTSGRGGPALSATDAEAPSIFTAIQEQLGLKLVPSQAKRDTLIIDRLERPTEN